MQPSMKHGDELAIPRKSVQNAPPKKKEWGKGTLPLPPIVQFNLFQRSYAFAFFVLAAAPFSFITLVWWLMDSW